MYFFGIPSNFNIFKLGVLNKDTNIKKIANVF